MKRSFGLGLLGAVFAVAALPALAQPDAHRAGPGGRLMQQADADRDGRITQTEGLNFLSARFTEADANKDGAVTREELGSFLQAQWEANRPAKAPARPARGLQQRTDTMFRAADANGDGRLTLEEVQPLAMAMFRAADRNNDGALEMAELRGGRHHHHHRRGGPEAPRPEQNPAKPG